MPTSLATSCSADGFVLNIAASVWRAVLETLVWRGEGRASRGHHGVRISVAGHAGRVARLVVSAAVTVLFGAILLFAPGPLVQLFRLQPKPEHPEAYAAARANMAGFYLGLGLSSLLLAQPLLYMALGFSWLFTAFGRIVSMMSDQGNRLYQLALAGLRPRALRPRARLRAGLRSLIPAASARASAVVRQKCRKGPSGNVLRTWKACARRQSTFDRGCGARTLVSKKIQ